MLSIKTNIESNVYKILKSTAVFKLNNKKMFLASNQYIRMISEGSCDTEDWSIDAEN